MTQKSGTRTAAGLDLRVRISAAEPAPVTYEDLRRLFPALALTPARLSRLAELPKALVSHHGRIVGLATWQHDDAELRIPDLGVEAASTEELEQIVDALLRIIDSICLAGGLSRVALRALTPALSATLARRGCVTDRGPVAGRLVRRLGA
jgi:hypothetical protein